MEPLTADRVTTGQLGAGDAVFLLENGARMDQRTFHALYEKTPEGFKAELIGGVVHVASPVSARHGKPHAKLIAWLLLYTDDTPGTDVYDNTTSVLGEDNEPQPDASLVIQPEYGGRTRVDQGGYLSGAPELVAEVAHSSASIDLGTRFTQYEKAGVDEYLVLSVQDQRAHWFVRRQGRFVALEPDKNQTLRSEAFPGLWLHPEGFFAPTMKQFLSVAERGRASPEHAAFVAELEARRDAGRRTKKRPGKKPPRKNK